MYLVYIYRYLVYLSISISILVFLFFLFGIVVLYFYIRYLVNGINLDSHNILYSYIRDDKSIYSPKQEMKNWHLSRKRS